nr:hypothetical protein [Mucilaginibacter sp. X4EP1]
MQVLDVVIRCGFYANVISRARGLQQFNQLRLTGDGDVYR